MNIQIAIQKMKISSTSKTFDMSDRSELDPDLYICNRSSGLYHLNILFLYDDICERNKLRICNERSHESEPVLILGLSQTYSETVEKV